VCTLFATDVIVAGSANLSAVHEFVRAERAPYLLEGFFGRTHTKKEDEFMQEVLDILRTAPDTLLNAVLRKNAVTKDDDDDDDDEELVFVATPGNTADADADADADAASVSSQQQQRKHEPIQGLLIATVRGWACDVHIDLLYVAKAMRGRNVGSELISKLAKKYPKTAITLITRGAKLVRFYRSLGFQLFCVNSSGNFDDFYTRMIHLNGDTRNFFVDSSGMVQSRQWDDFFTRWQTEH
jgi:ribosomal protein S18 acetylase RimI-like enzyme